MSSDVVVGVSAQRAGYMRIPHWTLQTETSVGTLDGFSTSSLSEGRRSRIHVSWPDSTLGNALGQSSVLLFDLISMEVAWCEGAWREKGVFF